MNVDDYDYVNVHVYVIVYESAPSPYFCRLYSPHSLRMLIKPTMLHALRAYPTLLRTYFARALEYRVQALIQLLWGASPLVMMAVWLTMVQTGPIGGFDANAFIGYYLGVTWMRRVTYLWIMSDVEGRIVSGELSAYLIRPLNMAHHLLTNAIAWLAATIGLVPILGPLVVKILALPFIWLLNGIGYIISMVAIRRGFSKDVLTYRGLTIALIVGIVIGYVVGKFV